MPRNRRLFMHDEVRYVTMRTERWLPLLATPFMEQILKGILAQAASLYEVIIGELIVMGNHIHMMIVVNDPGVVDRFFRYFKTESAHAVNALRGEKKGTVWEEGYDAPSILNLSSLIEKVIYLHTNPQRANLVRFIEEYPNISSWSVLKSKGTQEVSVKRIRRTRIEALPADSMSLADILRFSREQDKRLSGHLKLELNPRACFEALTATSDLTYEEYRQRIVDGVKEKEQELEARRRKERKSVVGALRLKCQSIFKQHIPSKFGKRMICICSDIATRIKYIRSYRAWCQLCVQAYEIWQAGNRSVQFPPGFYPPGLRPCASLLPCAFWD